MSVYGKIPSTRFVLILLSNGPYCANVLSHPSFFLIEGGSLCSFSLSHVVLSNTSQGFLKNMDIDCFFAYFQSSPFTVSEAFHWILLLLLFIPLTVLGRCDPVF